MKASDVARIRRAARRVREHFMECEEGVTAFCYDAAVMLVKDLKRMGYPAKTVKGTFEIDRPDPEVTPEEAFESGQAHRPIHHWVEVGALVVDPTATQFQDEVDERIPEIVIGTYKELPRYNPIRKRGL